MQHLLKLEKIKLLEAKLELQESLPHLYGFKWYPWARALFESQNKMNLLCAGNQISKSSTLIRRLIHRATAVDHWHEWWPHRKPSQFWYLMPSKDIIVVEVTKKWIPEFLPRNKFKDHPVYGWHLEWRGKYIFAIHFNSGASIYFKTYMQDPSTLQSGSVDEIGCDEELPEELFPELQFRLAATGGTFNMVFTATIGQPFWQEAIEERGPRERFPEAFKQQISMYDCLVYEDGSNSHWSQEKIEKIINTCGSQKEIDRRVFGRFVVDEGLRFETFTKQRNLIKEFPVPPTWKIYAGVDIGSGGAKGHPSAIVFLAVRPDYQYAVVFRGWRGDNIVTTSSDVVEKYIELRKDLVMSGQYYDYANRDFFTIASRMGEPFTAADKGNQTGEGLLNTLFRNQMLQVFEIRELSGLITELSTLRVDVDKRKSKDDYTDALRYAVTKIPWDLSSIGAEKIVISKKKTVAEAIQDELTERRKAFERPTENPDDDFLFINDIEAWNEFYEP